MTSDIVTRSTSVAPEAGTPTRWLKFLCEATGAADDFTGYLKRFAGYCLTGDTSEQILTFIYGEGGTGKSTLINTIQSLLGSYGTAAPM